MFFKKRKTEHIRKQFPVLNDRKLIYVDHACMSLRPTCVIDAISSYYTKYSSCAGRSTHTLSRELDQELIEARKTVASFIGAKPEQVAFTRNATESINIVARGTQWSRGDVVIISNKEHNSNVLPWKELESRGVAIEIVAVDSSGVLSVSALRSVLAECKRKKRNVKLIALHHVSNVDGIAVDVQACANVAAEFGTRILIDGCQAVGHFPVNVRDLGVDYYVWSAHKMFGPSGMGALYAKDFSSLEPVMLGGSTVTDVRREGFDLAPAPACFEAGLQDYAGILGFARACKFVSEIGLAEISKRIGACYDALTLGLLPLHSEGKIRLLDPKKSGHSIVTFEVPGKNAQDVGLLLDSGFHIAVRAGYHCAHIYHHDMKSTGTVRISLHVTNTVEEMSKIVAAVKAVVESA
ncbi:MAG TPA: aminotransferase class V-fold PLP-dependent enzyme [Acidobacteriota bacterium]|nr:aminotransferase class V-fold PLP-dependent enzyme [Acidobacteriota bacterium]